jgi:glycosyltransferase involved in cell wall biosynthesis
MPESNLLTPLVSIVAICYNHSNFLTETLDSISRQTYKNIELIIVDDFSSDNSVSTIKEWLNSNRPYLRISFIEHKKNLGLCKTLNEAVVLADGNYLQLISCDDILLDDKIEKQMHLFLENKNLAIVYSDMIVIDSNGQQIEDSFFKLCSVETENLPRGYVYEEVLKDNVIPAPSMLIDKSKLKTIGMFDESLVFEDWDFILRATKIYEVDFIREPTVYYRILNNSLSRKITPEYIESHLKMFEKQLLNATDYQKKLLFEKINYYCDEGYKIGLKNICYWMRYKSINNPNGFRNCLVKRLACLGVSYNFTLKIISLQKFLTRFRINTLTKKIQ